MVKGYNHFDGAMRVVEDRWKKGVTDALQITVALAETIRELKEVPAGKLYAALMTRIDHETFERLVKTLEGAGLVKRERSGMLRWIGPEVRG